MSNLDYNKSELIASLTEQLGAGLECMTASAEGARQASVEAPGAMQSRYDSGKEENGYLADALNLRSVGMKRGINGMRFTELPENPVNVGVGCLVRVEDDFGQDDYLVLPYAGGETIETNHGDVTVVTPEAPLGKSLMGLEKGGLGSYEVGGKTIDFKVIDLI